MNFKKLAVIIALLLGLVCVVIYFFTRYNKLEEINGQILKKDIEIFETQKVKQVKLDEIKVLDNKIITLRKEKDNLKIQYNNLRMQGLDYLSYGNTAFASTQNKEEIKQEIKNNSKYWEVKARIKTKLTKEQDYLHQTNNRLRKDIGLIDLHILALAVAKHETANCTKGYGKLLNNCQGLKNGRNCPCKEIGLNGFCKFNNPEESHQHFMCVWSKGYGNRLPTIRDAEVYSGHDRATIRRRNVINFYYQLLNK